MSLPSLTTKVVIMRGISDRERHELTEGVRSAVSAAIRERARFQPAEDVPILALTAAAIAMAEVTTMLNEAVMTSRHAGYSWTEIGDRIGITRQAARKRLGVVASDMGEWNADVRQVNSHTEMPVLKMMGREGWHSVGFGVLHHRLRRSDQQWEHRRDAFPQFGNRERLESEGWQHVGTFYPWQYFKRPLDLPAESPLPAILFPD